MFFGGKGWLLRFQREGRRGGVDMCVRVPRRREGNVGCRKITYSI